MEQSHKNPITEDGVRWRLTNFVLEDSDYAVFTSSNYSPTPRSPNKTIDRMTYKVDRFLKKRDLQLAMQTIFTAKKKQRLFNILRLLYVCGVTVQDAAKLLDVSTSTIRRLEAKAIELLTEYLNRDRNDEGGNVQ